MGFTNLSFIIYHLSSIILQATILLHNPVTDLQIAAGSDTVSWCFDECEDNHVPASWQEATWLTWDPVWDVHKYCPTERFQVLTTS